VVTGASACGSATTGEAVAPVSPGTSASGIEPVVTAGASAKTGTGPARENRMAAARIAGFMELTLIKKIT
jgi:hypothetical protein